MIIELAIIFLTTSIGTIWFDRVGSVFGFIIGMIFARKYKAKMNDHTDYKKIEGLFERYMGKKK